MLRLLSGGFAAACLLVACAQQPTLPDPALVRDTAQGTVQGIETRNGAVMWQGLPYAEAPVDDRRWQVTGEPRPWQGLRAPYAAPECTSLGDAFDTDRPSIAEGSEDCLYLDISAPQQAQGRKLPVMVWIHGGGNYYGGPGDLTGNRLAPDHDVVLVGVRYRTGPFGWFSHSALRESGEAAANFGLMDLVNALQWVQTNIAAFGGDPGRVTVFGESAGGRNVFSLLLSDKASGLFHRAIVQSGSSTTTTRAEAENFVDDDAPGHTNSTGEAIARMLIAAGKTTDRDAARNWLRNTAAADQLAFLRGLSVDEILDAYKAEPDDVWFHLPNAIRDGYSIPDEEPTRLLSDGRYNRVPTIMGTNRDENKLYQATDTRLVKYDFLGLPSIIDMPVYQRASYYGSQAWKLTGVDMPLSLMQTNNAAGVYGYRFDWDNLATPAGVDLPNLIGASHGMEIPFVFGQFDNQQWPENFFDRKNLRSRLQVSGAMMSYWAAFARDGRPGKGHDDNLPAWQAWPAADEPAPVAMVLDSDQDGGVRMAGRPLQGEVLVDELATDKILTDPALKCAIAEIWSGYRSWNTDQTDAVRRRWCDIRDQQLLAQ